MPEDTTDLQFEEDSGDGNDSVQPWKTQMAMHLVDGMRLLRRQLGRLSPDVEFCGKFLRIPYY
jgi:hypothetical protein